MDSAERLQLQWVINLEIPPAGESARKAWFLILAIHARDRSARVQEVLSAGPLEDLLARHGNSFIDRVEKQARIDPTFRKLLGGVWKSTMSDHIWSRVQAIRDRSGWDGIPE